MRNNATNAGRAGLILTFSLLAALLAGGCSGSANNHSVPFEPGKGHPADFVATHPSFAVAPDCLGCQPCHGYINMTDNVYDLRGGTSRVSCASVSFKGISCHAAGPGAATADHALPGWVDNVHFVSAAADLAGCKRCHGTDLRGQGGAAPSCYSASFTGLACHTGGPDHLLLAATWVVTSTSVPDTVSAHHNATFADGGVSCRQCHAANPPVDNQLTGGKSRVSCSTASRGGVACHISGPAFHPAGWLDCTARNTNNWHAQSSLNCDPCHGTVATSPKCTQVCHFTSNGRKMPSASSWPHVFNPTPTGVLHSDHGLFTDNGVTSVCVNCHATHNKFGQQPVCHNCHPPFPGGNHDNGWLQTHAVAARAGTASCAAGSGTSTCHGTNLAGGTGRACVACHKGDAPSGNPTPTGCQSCHGNPPPGGSAVGFPNVAGAHAKHAALAGVTCATCHTGAGMTTVRHFDNTVQIAFATGYNAQIGTLGYTATTTRANPVSGQCTAVICHGGQATPAWGTAGTLACTDCHRVRVTATPEYTDLVNTAYVQHTNHAGRGCTNCHNLALTGVNHWSSLTDRGIPAGRARASILSSLNYVSPGANQSNCSGAPGSCHN